MVKELELKSVKPVCEECGADASRKHFHLGTTRAVRAAKREYAYAPATRNARLLSELDLEILRTM